MLLLFIGYKFIKSICFCDIMKKGMSLEECIEFANEFIAEQGKCLLLFDVVNSRNLKDRKLLNRKLKMMMGNLNQKFNNYFPEHDLAVYGRLEKGFQFLLGDGSWTAINSTRIISEIIEYQKNTYPNIPLYWGVSKNGYDEENIKIVR